MQAPPLSEEELNAIYNWVDEIPLSRPKKNIARDFADGVLMAEIVHHYIPRIVEIHNYSPAHSTSAKLYNWNTLNRND
jgi:CAMSAP CH domain.